MAKNGLLGYISVYVDALDIEFKNMPVFNNDGAISINAPSLPPNPETYNKWFEIWEFYNKHDQLVFEKKVLEAFETYCKERSIPLDFGSGIMIM
jgi:hypothetical protein